MLLRPNATFKCHWVMKKNLISPLHYQNTQMQSKAFSPLPPSSSQPAANGIWFYIRLLGKVYWQSVTRNLIIRILKGYRAPTFFSHSPASPTPSGAKIFWLTIRWQWPLVGMGWHTVKCQIFWEKVHLPVVVQEPREEAMFRCVHPVRADNNPRAPFPGWCLHITHTSKHLLLLLGSQAWSPQGHKADPIMSSWTWKMTPI